MLGPTFKLYFFIFFNTQQNKHCLEARSPGGKSNVQRSHFFLLFRCCFLSLSRDVVLFLRVLFCRGFFFVFFLFSSRRLQQLLVLLGLQLLLPGLVQVNQSLVVEDKENEVQRVRGDADDAEVLQDKVEDVAQVERTHHRQDGCRHEDEGSHCTHSHS